MADASRARRAMRGFCFALICIIVAGNAIPLESIPEVNLRLTEINDTVGPIPGVYPNETIFLGFITNVRGVVLGSDSQNNLVHGWWSQLLMVKAAIAAFLNGSIVTKGAPTAIYPINYHLLFGDEGSFKEGGTSAWASSAHTSAMANRMLRGHNLVGQNFAPVRALVASYAYSSLIGKLSSSLGTPQLGFYTTDPKYGVQRNHYPYFVRTIPTTTRLVAALFVQHMNYTRVDEVACDAQQHRTTTAYLNEIYGSLGIQVYSVGFPVGDHTGWPPGYPPAAGVTPLAIHTDVAMKEKWDFLFTQLKENNAHVHLLHMQSECPLFDILSYAALAGLVGKGHLWITSNYKNLWNDQYIPVLRVIGPSTHGMVSPYAFVKPLDGSFTVEAKASPALDKLFEWLQWIDNNNLRTTLVPEPHLQSILTSEVFQKKTAQIWRGQQIGQHHAFDCVYATLLAINKLLWTVGTNFTNDQLLDTLKKVEFTGLTGEVKFNYDTGERIGEEQLLQYRVLYPGNDTYGSMPFAEYRRLTDDNYADLKVVHRRLAESQRERRLSTCTLPADTSPANLAPYLQCITSVCEDADGSVVSAMSSGQVPNCQAANAAAAAQGGDCNTDLAALLPTLPSGTYLWTVCPGQCKSQCADQRCYGEEIETCTPTGTDPQAFASYFGCLATFAMDGSSSLLNTMTGGSISNCPALYGYVQAQGGDCNFDLNLITAALPAGTPLKVVCQATCLANTPVCPVPAQPAGAALLSYFTCIEQNCLDADDGLVSTLSGAQIPSCAAGKAYVESQGGDCNFDLSTLLPSLPAGVKLWQLCGSKCESTCTACQVPADPSDATLLGSYFSCTEGKCANAEASLVSILSGGQIPNCAAGKAYVESQGGNCNFDLSTLLPSLPAGVKLWQLCGAECQTECEASKASASSCVAPSAPTPAAMLPYFDCLKGVCEDSVDSLISTLTGGQIPNCPAAYNYVIAQGGDCNLHLNTLSPGFPAGVQLWMICGKQCVNECLANPGPNRTFASYMQCRKNYCADSAPAVIANLTGGNVADCAALKRIARDDCTYDVAKTMPRLGEATPLWKMCSAACQCTDGSGPAPPPAPPPVCPDVPSACDFYSKANELTVVGRYITHLEMTDTPLYYDLTPIPPPNLNLPCQLGQMYETQSAECLNCPKGKYTDKFGQTACTECKRGEANPYDGSGACEACPWGKFSDELASTECKSCTAGRYIGEPLQSECRSCSPGLYSLEKAYHCIFCEPGRFQNQIEATACYQCEQLIPGSSSTAASTSNASCKCLDGAYYRPGIGCQACTDGLVCPGGNDIPYQALGFQAYITDARTRGYDIYECAKPDWCPNDLPGACAANRKGPSCSQMFGKDCPLYAAVGIPIVGVILAFVAYKVTAHSRYGQVSQVMILAGNISIALVAMQAVSVQMSFFSSVPEDLRWIADFTQVFMMQFNIVLPQCNIGQSFAARYAMAIFPPVAVVGVFLFLWAVTGVCSRVFPFIAAFSFDGTINVIGMILQVLYVMQCKDAFAFFNTVSHPSGQETLKSFTDVIVWSDTHISPGTLIVTAYLFVFYVIGTYCLFIWVVVNARTKVKEKKFVARFRFVISRWRPECWHWGLWLLLRNLCIAITPIVARTHIAFQSCLYVIFFMGHALLEARYMPWAAMINTWFEVTISTLLSMMAVGALIFDDDPTSTPDETAMVYFLSAGFSSIWAIVAFSMVWMVWWGGKAHRKKKMEARFDIGCDLISSCAMIAEKLERGEAQVQKAWKSFVESSGDYDEVVLVAALAFISRFSDPDPLRRTTFISTITSYNGGQQALNEPEKLDQDAADAKLDKQVQVTKESSMSTDVRCSVLEQLGLEKGGNLVEGAEKQEEEEEEEQDEQNCDAKSDASDNTITV